MTIPKPAELSEMQMDELCKSVTEHALEGTVGIIVTFNSSDTSSI